MVKRLTLIPLLLFGLHAGSASAFGIPALLGILFSATAKDAAPEPPREAPRNVAAEEAAHKARVAELKSQLSAAVEQVEMRPALTPLQREWEIIRLEDHYYGLMQPSGATAATAAYSSPPAPAQPVPRDTEDFFAPDRGLRLHVEFVGSPSLTERLRASLLKRGHTLADNPMLADVIYRIEGQFRLDETALYEGLTIDAGAHHESPRSQPPLKEKPGVRARRALAATLQTLGQRKAVLPPRSELYQAALVVAARQAVGDREVRIFSMQDGEFPDNRADSLIRAAIADMLARLGIESDNAALAQDKEFRPR